MDEGWSRGGVAARLRECASAKTCDANMCVCVCVCVCVHFKNEFVESHQRTCVGPLCLLVGACSADRALACPSEPAKMRLQRHDVC